MSAIWRLSGVQHFRTRLSRAVLLVALALCAVGAPSAFASDEQVIIVQPSDPLAWGFEPEMIVVPAGTSVTWVNQGALPMTVTSPDGLFDSGEIAPGGWYTATFDTPGTFRYFCVPYPHMKGIVIVTH